jgi:peptidyl-dipeptidase Dcp
MKHKTLALIFIIALFLASCNKNTTKMNNNNPLLQPFTNEYGIPPFDKIKPQDFMPAFKIAMQEQIDSINKIVNNTQKPTFKNTIEAFEFSGLHLSQISAIFYNLLSANTNPQLDSIAQQLASLMTEHQAKIAYNEKLFAKIKTIYNKRDSLKLSQEQYKLLTETYKHFVRSGVDLAKDKQEQLKNINEQLSKLTLQFGKNNLDEINQYKLVIDNKKDLAGLPQNVIDNAAARAKKDNLEGKWVFTIQKPVMIPFLQYAKNRELRKKLYMAYTHLGDNNNQYDNKKIINKIVNLRIQKAHLLGYKNYADYVLDENMAKNPKNVYDLLYKIWDKALPVAHKEAKELQQMIYKEGNNFKLASWDWWYYAEKLRKQKYSVDENEIKQYFPLDSVQKGLFSVVKKLYNLNIERLNNVPLPHPDAQAFKVTDAKTGKLIGIVFMDFFTRASKRAGAWMDNYVNQYKYNGKEQRPVITTVFNFPKPAKGPALLTMEQVSTMFHEFGHALHGLLSQCTYPSLSGTNVPRDFVEFPSQFMENYANDPSVIKTFAKNYKTGKTIPDELLNKIQQAAKFNQGFNAVEYLAAAILDMDYHTLNDTTNINVDQFENNTMKRINMPPQIVVRYRSTYFRHIFAGGYAAGYYSYIWAEVLDADAFEAFKETGNIFNQKIAQSLRKNVLEKGGTEDAMKLYINFRGKKPSIEPLLKRKGLL